MRLPGLVRCVNAVFAGCPALSRLLSADRRALWCSDIAHLLYSAGASAAALLYIAAEPRAVQLHNQPADVALPSAITAVSAGGCNTHTCFKALE